MDAAHDRGGEQAALWNGAAGCAWVEAQATLDQIMEPIERLLTDAVAALSPRRVLDVGCGTGATTLAVARRLDDPVRAFANLRRAARPRGGLRFIAWRSPEENPFMTAAERAAAPLLPSLPPYVPDAPGRFAFADADRVRRILDASGWAGIELQPIDVECTMPERELAGYATRFGPLARVLDDVDQATRTRIVDAALAAFAPYVHGAKVRWVAACWMVHGCAP